VVLTLVTVPYLARVLRPEGWGPVVFAQSFAGLLTLVLEYGFYLSASREIARCREDEGRVAEIVAEVQAAKLILVMVVTIAAAGALRAIPLFRQHPVHLVFSWLLAVAQGFSPLWFYQGIERQVWPALGELLSKGAAAGLLLTMVRGPGDGALALGIQGGVALGWTVVANAFIYRVLHRARAAGMPGAGILSTEGAGETGETGDVENAESAQGLPFPDAPHAQGDRAGSDAGGNPRGIAAAPARLRRDSIFPRILRRMTAGARMLRETFRLFVFRAASGSYVTANSFLIGAMAAPPVVAFYGGAERLIRGALNGIAPATQAVYPRVSRLVRSDQGAAGRLLGLSLLCVGGMGAVIGATAFAAAGLLAWARKRPVLAGVLLGIGGAGNP
jgi:O-antigen/teichoic acid export membrane protein